MQKKIFIGIFLPVFFLSGCKNEVLPSKVEPVLHFICRGITNTSSGELIEFNLTKNEDKNIKIQITSSNFAKGLCIEKTNESISIGYEDLKVKNNDFILPRDSFIKSMINIFDYLDSKSELEFVSAEGGVVTKKCAKENFEIDIFISSGFIKEIRIPKDNITIALSDFENI